MQPKAKVKTIVFLLLLATSLILPKPAYAATFGLIGPTEQLTRGQEVTFTITVDTKGESYETLRIGLEYDTKYLEFLNAIPGDTFSSISVEEIETGRLVLTGNNDPAFSGSGVFSYVKFKLIAENPGTTQLCALFNPETEQTPTPTPPSPTPTPRPVSTSAPTPTELPKSGNEERTRLAAFAAAAFFALPLIGIVASRLKIF